MIVFYHQTKIPIGFWCRQKLNSRSLIQQLETLLIKLVETHTHLNWLITLSNLAFVISNGFIPKFRLNITYLNF